MFAKKQGPRIAEDVERLEQVTSGPIIACVGTPDSFDEATRDEFQRLKATEVDYYGDPKRQKASGMSNAGENTHVISAVDGANKHSDHYINCIGTAVIGFDEHTGKNVSFLTHQDPWQTLTTKKDAFVRDLDSKLDKLVLRVRPETIDAVIWGGQFKPEPTNRPGKTREHDYLDIIALVSERIRQKAGVEPHVVIGPDVNGWGEAEVWLDTQRRRLYVMRSNQPENRFAHNVGFSASELSQRAKEWREEENRRRWWSGN